MSVSHTSRSPKSSTSIEISVMAKNNGAEVQNQGRGKPVAEMEKKTSSKSSQKQGNKKDHTAVTVPCTHPGEPKPGPSAYDMANPFSRMSFTWAGRILALGHKRPLELEDINTIEESLQSQGIYTRFEKAWETEQKKANPKLWKAALRVVQWDILYAVVLGMFYTVTPFILPILLQRMFNVFARKEPLRNGLIYSSIVYGLLAIGGVIQCHIQATAQRAGIKVRTCMNTMIYKNSFSLGPDAMKTTSTGQVYNLIGQQSEQVFRAFAILGVGCYLPFQTLLAVGYLIWVMGYAALAGVVVLIIGVPMNYKISNSFVGFLMKRFFLANKRVDATNEALQAIRIIKFAAWEKTFIKKIAELREPEIVVVRQLLRQIAMLMASVNFLPGVFQLVVFVVYTFYHDMNDDDVTVVYQSISILNVIRQSFALLPLLATSTKQALAACESIQTFLQLPKQEARVEARSKAWAIKLEGVTASWGKEGDKVLEDVDLEIKHGELIMVVGKVGTGKSTLLSTFLGEATATGKVESCGKIAYMPQQAWIMNATVKDNILFQVAKDDRKYDQVLYACDFVSDLDNLPKGDQTEIGEKGINLSGGQKQRISIARGLYSDADIYLLDDSLSAVDVHVGKHIYDHCISSTGMMSRSTRVLVTNQLGFLQHADRILLIKDNKVLQVTMESEELKEMLAQHAGNVDKTENAQNENAENGENEDNDDELITEQSPLGAKPDSPTYTSSAASPMSPPMVTAEPNFQTKKVDEDEEMELVPQMDKEDEEMEGRLLDAEDRMTGAITWGTYATYLREFGGVGWFSLNIFFLVMMHGTEKFSQLWLGWWAENDKFPDLDDYYWLAIYGGIIVLSGLFVLAKEYQYADGAAKPPRALHHRALIAMMGAPVRFFDTTPAGRIINRFTTDILELDFLLPFVFNTYISMYCVLAAALISIMFATWWFVFVIVIVGGIYVLLTRYYTDPSLELRRIFAITKSPMFQHFDATLSGLSTIRAFKMQSDFWDVFCKRLDINHACYYAERMAFEWMRFRSNQLAALMVGGAAFMLVIVSHFQPLDPALAGLALSQALLVVVTIAAATEFYTQAVMAMASVERLAVFSNIAQEETPAITKGYTETIPNDWPAQGRIEFHDVTMKYRPKTPTVLNGLSFDIQPGEKIGVVGRTGSGKSTTLLALLRILMPTKKHGKIVVDGIDITKIPTDGIRQGVAIIPQEPVLFNGPIRFSLDPTGIHTDEAIMKAVEVSHLKEFLDSKAAEGSNPLDFAVSENGKSLSVGQAQLVCLARAVLQNQKILLMDEATASVDVTTDKLIQDTIRSHFAHATIITIAHRLHTILDSDRILVMRRGKAQEFDTPSNLLANPDSALSGMVRKKH